MNRAKPSRSGSAKSNACEAFVSAFCRKRGLKWTAERRAVLAAVENAGEHFDPEWLLQKMQAEGVRASRATLYRTLQLLQQAGVIQQVLHGHKHMHYEFVFGRGEHDHIVDVDTGDVVEFANEEVVRLLEAICAAHGYRPVSHRLQILAVRDEGNPKGRARC